MRELAEVGDGRGEGDEGRGVDGCGGQVEAGGPGRSCSEVFCWRGAGEGVPEVVGGGFEVPVEEVGC